MANSVQDNCWAANQHIATFEQLTARVRRVFLDYLTASDAVLTGPDSRIYGTESRDLAYLYHQPATNPLSRWIKRTFPKRLLKGPWTRERSCNPTEKEELSDERVEQILIIALGSLMCLAIIFRRHISTLPLRPCVLQS